VKPAPAHNRSTSDAAAGGWHELEVANPSFFVEKLGAECSDLQGLRELTVNGVEAIAALGAGATGRVLWDLDWARLDAGGGRRRKLSVVDTGIGMTPEQMRYFINHLTATSHAQGHTGNYGVGAKVAAGSRNPHGLEYRSWHQGRGALVRFKRHRDGRWGLEPQRWPNGDTDYWRPLHDGDKPWLLRGLPHGTQVVLLGDRDNADTTRAPASVTEARSHWISRYLTTRFLRVPPSIELLVRESNRMTGSIPDGGHLQRIHGHQHHLQQRAIDTGTLELSDARVHWWMLDDDHRGRRHESHLWISSGHAGAVFDGELYDVLPQTRGGYQRLQDFGIRFGYERVVLYIQPHADNDQLETNTARTQLLLHHEPLPWARWAEEFRAAMPEQIRQLQERVAGTDNTPRAEAIRSRLAAHLPLYHISRYRAPRLSLPAAPGGTGTPVTGEGVPEQRSGTTAADHAHVGANAPPDAEQGPSDPAAQPETSVDTVLGVPVDPVPAEAKIAAQLPDVVWVSLRDGTRAPGDLEDQAARYHLDRHELTVNADFRVFTDMTSRWLRHYRGIPGARSIIETLVREWFEQALVEVVLSVRGAQWSDEQVAALLSPESLTSATLPRQLLDAAMRKRLAQKLGR
jgi:hypothetical protein